MKAMSDLMKVVGVVLLLAYFVTVCGSNGITLGLYLRNVGVVCLALFVTWLVDYKRRKCYGRDCRDSDKH